MTQKNRTSFMIIMNDPWHELVKNLRKIGLVFNQSQRALFVYLLLLIGEINSQKFVKIEIPNFVVGSGEQLSEELKFTMISM